jgi:hypothetical protein
MLERKEIFLFFLIIICGLTGCATTTTYTFDRIYGYPTLINESAKEAWSITIQDKIVRAGDGAVRFELRPFDGRHETFYKGFGSRAELSEWKIKAKMNSDVWYGFSMFIPDQYPAFEGKSMVCGQWHQAYNYDYPPLSQNYDVTNEELHVMLIPARFWTSPDGTKHYSKKRGLWKIKNFKQNMWHDLIYNIKWTTDDNGYFKLWHNGVLKIDFKGLTYIPGEKIGPYFKFGLYQMSVAASKSEIHVLYFDEYRRGSSYEAVDPAQNEKNYKVTR